MQAALAAASAAAAAAPVAYGLQAATAVAGGLSSFAQAKGAQNEAKINSFIGRTRAIQTDGTAREGLESELGTLRATLSANGQRPTVGTSEIFSELRRVGARDRRVEFGNRMQEASAYDRQAKGYGTQAKLGLGSGFLKAAPSIFDIHDWKQKNKKV